MKISQATIRENERNTYYPIRAEINGLEDLLKTAKFDHAAPEYVNNHRAKKDYIRADCVIMDIDNTHTENPVEWVTPEVFKERFFPNVEMLIIFSRNHLKVKEGKAARPKFHVYFPLRHEILSDTDESNFKELLLKICPLFDPEAKDAARFIFGVENPTGLKFDGGMKIDEFIEKKKADNPEIFNNGKNQRVESGNTTAKKEASGFKNDKGHRNSDLYRKGISFLIHFDSQATAQNFFEKAASKQNPPLGREEISRIWQQCLKSDLYAATKQLRELYFDSIEAKEDNPSEKTLAFIRDNPPENLSDTEIKKLCKDFGEWAKRKEKSRPKSLSLTQKVFEDILDAQGISYRFNVISKEIDALNLPEQYMSKKNESEKDFEKRRGKKIWLNNYLHVALSDLLKDNSVKFSRSELIDIMSAVAEKTPYNPVAEMLAEKKWDGLDRVKFLENEILHISDNPLYCMFLEKWLHEAVSMWLNDEDSPYGAEFVLFLVGAQGIGKTSFFQTLFSCFDQSYFKDGLSIDMRNKDTLLPVERLLGAELGEAESTFKRDQEEFKAYITSATSEIRPPYGIKAKKYVRHCVFCGTTNEERFLRDTTGNRRFAAIKINSINLDSMRKLPKEWFSMLWRQVYECYYLKDVQGFRFTPEERNLIENENRQYREFTQGEREILETLDFNAPKSEWKFRAAAWVWDSIFDKSTIIDTRKIGRALTTIARENKDVAKRTRHKIGEYLLPPVRKNFESLDNSDGMENEKKELSDNDIKRVREYAEKYYFGIYEKEQTFEECLKGIISHGETNKDKVIKEAAREALYILRIFELMQKDDISLRI